MSHCHHAAKTEITLTQLLVLLALIAVMLYFLVQRSRELDRQELNYLTAHKCVIAAMQGTYNNPKPAYRCDNGTWTQHDIHQLMSP